MKKDLYRFINGSIQSIDEYVEFKYDKIIYAKISYYYSVFVESSISNKKNNINYNEDVIWDYDIVKRSKAERIYKIANYKIDIHELRGNIDHQYFIKLNVFESFMLKWYKGKTIFNRLTFYEKLLITIIGIAAIFIPIYCSNQKSEQIKSPNPNLNTNSQSTINVIDSAIIHDIKDSRKDSLCLDSFENKLKTE